MISEGWQHLLSFSIRFNDHFTNHPITDELPVRLDHSFINPVVSSAGGYRQDDGTYRFINLEAGDHHVRWLPPFEDSFRGWVSWENDPLIHVPVLNPNELIVHDLWPDSNASVAPGTTAVRGQLIGSNRSGLRVSLSHASFTLTRFTRSDENGEFLFPLYDPLETNVDGLIELDIEVAEGTRTVVSGEFVPAVSGLPFAGSVFAIVPGRSSRIKYQIS